MLFPDELQARPFKASPELDGNRKLTKALLSALVVNEASWAMVTDGRIVFKELMSTHMGKDDKTQETFLLVDGEEHNVVVADILAEQFSPEDLFVHSLSGPVSDFMLADPAPHPDIAHLPGQRYLSVSVYWHEPGAILIKRPIVPAVHMGFDAGGKSVAMAMYVSAAQAAGKKVIIIDPKASGSPVFLPGFAP